MLHKMRLFIALLALACLLFCLSLQTVYGLVHTPSLLIQDLPSNENGEEVSSSTPPPLVARDTVVEVAVVCDLDCTRMFQNDEEKLVRYLKSLFYGMNWRFKAVSNNIAISFRVTSVTMIERTEQQPFVEVLREYNQEVSMDDVLHGFSAWMYQKKSTLPDFDVAMGLLGAPVTNYGDSGWADQASVCKVDNDKKKIGGSFIMQVSKLADPSTTAYRLMSLVLGSEERAPSFYCRVFPDESCSRIALDGYTSSKFYPSSAFFSTINRFEQFVSTEKAYCLRRPENSKSTKAIIDTETLSFFTLGASVEEQCKLFLNDTTATSYSTLSRNCKITECTTIIFRPESKVIHYHHDINVMDGTLCEDHGRCFRGRCVRVGFQLVSISSNLCLGIGSKNCTNDDNLLQMVPCSTSPHWSNVLHFRDSPHKFQLNGDRDSGHLLVIPFPNTDTTNISLDQCLTVSQEDSQQWGNSETRTVSVANCSSLYPSFSPSGLLDDTALYLSEWHLMLTGNGRSFLVVHAWTLRCLTPREGNFLQMIDASDCHERNSQALWRLVPLNESDILQLEIISKPHYNDPINIHYHTRVVDFKRDTSIRSEPGNTSMIPVYLIIGFFCTIVALSICSLCISVLPFM